MSIDRAWVSEKLLGDAGFRIEYLHTIEIHVGPLSRHAYRDRRIAMEVGQSVTQWGNTAELLARICSSVVGLLVLCGMGRSGGPARWQIGTWRTGPDLDDALPI